MIKADCRDCTLCLGLVVANSIKNNRSPDHCYYLILTNMVNKYVRDIASICAYQFISWALIYYCLFRGAPDQIINLSRTGYQ